MPSVIDNHRLHSDQSDLPTVRSGAQTHFEQLQSLLPVEDLSAPFKAGVDSHLPIFADFGANSIRDIARSLCHERKGQAIITGDRGVGKTTLVRLLAAEVARCRFPRLVGRRFIRLDVSNVGPEDSRAYLGDTAFSRKSCVPIDGTRLLQVRQN